MGKWTYCYICFLWFEAIFEAFMAALSVINLSCWVNVKVKKLLVTFANFEKVTFFIFLASGKLKVSAVTLGKYL